MPVEIRRVTHPPTAVRVPGQEDEETSLVLAEPSSGVRRRVLNPPDGDNRDDDGEQALDHVDESPPAVTPRIVELTDPVCQETGERASPAITEDVSLKSVVWQGGWLLIWMRERDSQDCSEVKEGGPAVDLGRRVPCCEDKGASGEDARLEDSENYTSLSGAFLSPVET